MLLGENEFLPKIFKLCSNLSLFSNYLVSCSCFGTRFFENWVPHITWFYHFWIMWKFCHTRLRRCGFTLFKKFQLQLNFLKIKFHRFFFWYHYLLLVLANSSQFWKEKKSVTRYLTYWVWVKSLNRPTLFPLSFSRITYLPFFLLQ